MNARLARVAIVAATICAAAPSAGQEVPREPRWSWRTDVQSIGAVAQVAPTATSLNPGNRLLGLPQTTWLTEIRVHTRLEEGSRWTVIVRPRLRLSAETTRAESTPTRRRMDASFQLTEAHLTWRPSDALSFTYGLQNFQWGPAEMIGPSNRLFHEIGVFRDPLYVARGKDLARMNLSAGRSWSVVALAELAATDEEPFRAEAPFRRAAQAKVEYTTPSGDAYFGVTAGARAGERSWAGGYAAASTSRGLSAYLDAVVQRGSAAWYPVSADAGSTVFRAGTDTEEAHSMALAGLRYSYSAALDARLEYLHQDAGYTRAQVAAAAVAVMQRPSPESVARWLSPGLEFLGRDLVLFSVLSTDIFPGGRMDLNGRYVRSVTDGSAAGFVTASLDAGDALVVFGSLTLTHGPTLTEFTRLVRAGAAVGFVWSR